MRLQFEGWPAAELWDPTTGEGEFTVIVGNRFVVKAEGTHLVNVATAQQMVGLVDLKAVEALR